MAKLKEIKKGERFGQRTALGESKPSISGKAKIILEKCKCDCGVIRFVLHDQLLGGRTKSCGCSLKEYKHQRGLMRKKHGMRGTRIYEIYCGIIKRCNNKKSKSYNIYGGRGIKCERLSFEEFYKDMGDSYNEHVRIYGEKDTTIDRIDNNKNYCKDNCKRSTKLEQSNNTRNNKKIEYNGILYTSISDFCRNFGLSYSTTQRKLAKGYKIEDIIFK